MSLLQFMPIIRLLQKEVVTIQLESQLDRRGPPIW